MTAAASAGEAIMAITRLEKGGRLSLPQDMLASHRWQAGTEFAVEDRPEGLLLRPLHDRQRATRETAPGHHDSIGRDRALAEAMRDRMARYGH
jgi:hypothetical protein